MFCDRCGARLNSGARFCGACGHAVGGKVLAMSSGDSRLARHLKLLAVLWMGLGALNVVGAAAGWIVTRFVLERLVGSAGIPAFVPPLVTAALWLVLLKGLASFAAGWGLLEREAWGRILALVVGFVSLLNVPLGTALGIYTLWVLLPAQADDEYRRLSLAA